MTARERFRAVMAERKRHRPDSLDHDYLTRAALRQDEENDDE